MESFGICGCLISSLDVTSWISHGGNRQASGLGTWRGSLRGRHTDEGVDCVEDGDEVVLDGVVVDSWTLWLLPLPIPTCGPA